MGEMFQLDGTNLIIKLPKELDHHVSDQIREETEKVMCRTLVHKIFFDFTNTGFMDSSGIGLIMGRYKALGMRRGCIQAIGVDTHVEKLLRLAGLHRYVEIQKIKEQEGV